MEALIELGAIVCQKTPFCNKCPLRSDCQAFIHNKIEEIPYKKVRKQTIYLNKQVAIIFHKKEVLLEIKEEKLFADLAQFPAFMYSVEKDLEMQIREFLGLEVFWKEDLSKEKQSYTTYQEELFPSCFEITAKKEIPGFSWHSIEDLTKLPFTSGHRRILRQLNARLKV